MTTIQEKLRDPSSEFTWGERIDAADRIDALEKALKPFSEAAGAFFSQNGESGDLIYDGGHNRSDCIFGEDLFAARAALHPQTPEKEKE